MTSQLQNIWFSLLTWYPEFLGGNSRVGVGDADGLALPLVRPDDQQRHHEPEDDAEDGVEEDDDGVLREAVVLGVAELQLGHDDDQK